MLPRQSLKRGHKPPTASPKIRPSPKLRLTAACARPVAKKVSRNAPRKKQPKQFGKQQLYEMLAEAVKNTG
jgi:GcrA cell cycle regulator